MPIALQLKSTQRKEDLDDISKIIAVVRERHGYRVKGHEVQQLASIMKKTTMHERAGVVADFCSKNEIEYLSYHAQIFENGENIWEDKWNKIIQDSIMQSIEEADMVRNRAGIKNDDVVIVFHLTGYLPKNKLLTVTREEKLELQSKSEKAFLGFYEEERIAEKRKGIVMAVENSYPKYYQHYAIAGPFHPAEITRLEGYGIKTVLDLSHYHLYSNYLRYGQGNLLGDLDREIHGSAPSWQECIRILSKSLIQLHISDAKGFDSAGEGLPLGKGEIPIAEILQYVHSGLKEKVIRGTLELGEGHLHNGQLQLEGVQWLLDRLPREIFESANDAPNNPNRAM